jgi:hypothetical protein
MAFGGINRRLANAGEAGEGLEGRFLLRWRTSRSSREAYDRSTAAAASLGESARAALPSAYLRRNLAMASERERTWSFS